MRRKVLLKLVFPMLRFLAIFTISSCKKIGINTIKKENYGDSHGYWKAVSENAIFTNLNIRIYLKHDLDVISKLENRLWEISDPYNPDYGKYLSVFELRERISSGPNNDKKIDTVIKWINNQVLFFHEKQKNRNESSIMPYENVVQWRVSITRDDIVLTRAPALLLNELFGAEQINEYISLHKTANEDTNSSIMNEETNIYESKLRLKKCPFVPDALSEFVEFIFYGMCDDMLKLRRDRKNLRIQRKQNYYSQQITSNPASLSVDPPLLYQLYDIERNHTSSTPSQSVAEFEKAYFFANDLSSFQFRYGLPLKIVHRIIGPNKPEEGYLGEASLDTQYATATASMSPLWVLSHLEFDMSWWAETILNATLIESESAPRVHSVSWGSTEEDFPSSLLARWNTEFLKLAVTGHSVLVASGDNGNDNTGWFRCKKFRVDFPGSSPFVTSIGGTTLLQSSSLNKNKDSKSRHETAWEDSGGGFSNTFPRPPYQNEVVTKYLEEPDLPDKRYYNNSGRAVPDVSAVATNYQVLVQNFWGNISGTSASAPVWAGLVAILNHHRPSNRPMGFLNPWLYSLQKKGGIGRDIIDGHNSGRGCKQGFPAVVGYDTVTGLGVPNHTLLIEESAQYFQTIFYQDAIG